MLDLDLVVIGKNCGSSVAKIYQSQDYQTQVMALFNKCIFVDSASTDDSSNRMAALGFDCYELEAQGRLSPAAGRFVGTLVSTSKFILFLDSDMQLADIEHFQDLTSEFLEQTKADSSICGMTGRVVDHYPNRSTRQRGFNMEKDGSIRGFGGFVLLERQSLLEVGGWNKDVLANEELELQARLDKFGKRVLGDPRLSVQHHTLVRSPVLELLGAYLPLRPDRFGGMGMALHASWRYGSLRFLVARIPEPFLLLGLGLVWTVTPMHHQLGISLLIAVSYSLWVIRKRGAPFLAVVPSFLTAGFIGLLRYKELPVYWKKLS